jgi:hypothetical protein
VLTFDALTGPDPGDPSRTVVEVALERMRDAKRPMPPSGLLPAAEIALLDAWQQGGRPRGTCAAPPTDASASDRPEAAADLSGLPCDLATLLVDHCTSCHTPPDGTPLTYEALTAPSSKDPTKTLATVALERMKNATRPMPPSGLLPAATVSVLEGWEKSGMPRGSCALPPPDAAAGDAGASDAAVDLAGLPCDLTALLGDSCATCHTRPGNTPLTYASLTGPWSTDPTRTLASVALARMQDTANPMPPSGVLAADRIAVLGAWLAQGTPHGSCAPADAGPDPFATPMICSSGAYWTGGDRESALMHPGRACGSASCHGAEQFGGTVFPTGHEPDECNGIAGGAQVIIKDANGVTYTLSVNGVGNFRRRIRGLALPYTAKVVVGGRERPMLTPQTSGDCNQCHTATGTPAPTGAPGRVMSP